MRHTVDIKDKQVIYGINVSLSTGLQISLLYKLQ